MTEVTRKDVEKAVRDLGIKEGDVVLVHSSFKSMGHVVGGAEDVIGGFLDVLGEEGTLVFPCFTQKDFATAYETWHIDKPSDTGYLTNYFRLREGSLRSDQATHSVAVCGKLKEELTKTHGHTHKRYGSMGDTPFSADSPWEKMYHLNAKVVLLGVNEGKITFRHYAEYVYIEELLKKLEGNPKYDEMKDRLWHMGQSGPWPHIANPSAREILAEEGYLPTESTCGDATFTCFESKIFVDTCLAHLRSRDRRILWDNGYFDVDGWYEWLEEYNALVTGC